jgi:hypothetical protein
MLGVEDGHALPDQRVPCIVNLTGITDTGRMNGSLSNGERFLLARGAPKVNSPSLAYSR